VDAPAKASPAQSAVADNAMRIAFFITTSPAHQMRGHP
jgi:hypothetical protein